MDVFTPDRLIVLVAFFLLLGLAWLVVRLKQGPISAKLKRDRAMDVLEVLPLGGDGRAILIRVHAQEVLVVNSRKGGTALLPITDVKGEVRP